MPRGLVRSGDFRKGTPLILPHVFGNPVILPEPFEGIQPQSNASLNSNLVTWVPNPVHFGNSVDLSLQTVPPVVIVAPGGTGTTNINITQLLGAPTPTLTYSGAPAGVTLTFVPNPDTGTSVCTITVGTSVPVGKYTITIIGTSGTEVNSTNLHLVVALINYSNLLLVTTPISVAQILSMSTNPIILVPAQGPNTVIAPVWWTLEYTPGSLRYTLASETMNMGYNGNSDGPDLPFVDFVQLDTKSINAPLPGYPVFPLSAANDQPLTLTMNGGQVTGGNGTMVVNVWYFVVPTV
jgi:hypothetical protein